MSREHAPKLMLPAATALGGLAVGYLMNERGSRRRLQQSEAEKREAQAHAQRMAELARRDPLTGLYNRRVMVETYAGMQASSQLERRSSDHGPGSAPGPKDNRHSLILLDIDNFKRINDTLGHNTGNDILRSLANSVMARDGHARQRDVAVRLGGDEMALFLQRATQEDAVAIAERLRGLCQQDGRFTTSFGVVELDLEASLEDNLAMADLALYEAKRNGRDQIQEFTPELMQTAEARSALIASRGYLFGLED